MVKLVELLNLRSNKSDVKKLHLIYTFLPDVDDNEIMVFRIREYGDNPLGNKDVVKTLPKDIFQNDTIIKPVALYMLASIISILPTSFQHINIIYNIIELVDKSDINIFCPHFICGICADDECISCSAFMKNNKNSMKKYVQLIKSLKIDKCSNNKSKLKSKKCKNGVNCNDIICYNKH